MRLLVAAPFPPRLDAVHGGSRVIAERLLHTAERHDVHLLHLEGRSDAPLDETLSRRLTAESVSYDGWPRRGWRRRARAVRGLLAGRPLWAIELRSSEFARRLAVAVGDVRPDVVQLEFAVLGQYAPGVRDEAVPILLVDHDADREASVVAGPGRRLLRRLDRRAWRRFERAVLGVVDAAVVFTEKDRERLTRVASGTPVVRIPIGTDAVRGTAAGGSSTSANVLFVGNFVHPPNAAAAGRLVDRIFPLVRARVPVAALTIVGAGPPEELTQRPGVHVPGRVESLAPYYRDTAVFAVPLELGGGMRVKVVEALAAGLPIVASPLAVEGLDVADGREVLLATTDEEFADRIVQVLETPELRAGLAASSAAWARANLAWETVCDAYDRLYADLAAR